MDTWEKEYVRSNLVSLIDEIDSSVILSYLLQSNVISRLEKEQLIIIGRHNGLIQQSEKLLDIIRGRINGYQHLVKALYNSQQTGPLITLLYGVQINTLANPFQYCGIEPKLDEILLKKVSFGGHQLRLADICKNLNEEQVNALRKNIDVSIYKCLIGCDEVTIAEDTIPTGIPYYIPRTISLRNKLEKRIFKDRKQDYFLIENIEPYQLSGLAQIHSSKETTRCTHPISRQQQPHFVSTSVSSEQMHKLTTRFILLENERHYDHISDRSKEQSIHYIKFHDDNYFLIRSSKSEDVKSYILDEELYISEKDFLTSTSFSHPVIIFDTPRMGKSAVLTNLAYQYKLQVPTAYVIYFEMQDLVSKLVARSCDINISLIEIEILVTISTNKFGTFINRELFNKPHRVVTLFLDAFDEVNSENQNVAINVVKILNDNKHRFKIYITSRSHQGDILEKICGVVGYGILPFQLQEQVNFLVEYWHNQYTIESSEEGTQFAKTILSVFRDKISSKDRDITGIPLQCRMLADVYARDVQAKCFSLKNSNIWTIWTHTTEKVLKPAVKVFKDCINIVLGRHYSSSEFNDLNWLDLKENCNYKLMCLAFKVKLGMCPSVFKQLICESAIRKYNTRSGSHEISTKSLCPDHLSYMITNAWAQTPEQLKICDSYIIFKENLKKWFVAKRVKSDIGCDLSCIDKVIEDSILFSQQD